MAFSIKFAQINGQPALTAKKWLDKRWPFKRGALYHPVDTHIISAIINVAQKVNRPWPLYIMDHHKNRHKVYLKPGEMLWYESSVLPHGRLDPLDGDHYDNLFVSYFPSVYQ